MPDKPNPAAFTMAQCLHQMLVNFTFHFQMILEPVAYDKEGLATLEMEYKANLGGEEAICLIRKRMN